MNDAISTPAPVPEPLEFTGAAGRFFGLAFVNLLLTIVTIGIYRFWAKTRVRRYLWESTRFQGEALEYTGRGIEKFLGALIVFGVLIVPLAVLSLLAAVFGDAGKIIAALLYLPLYFGLLYLFGVAVYRSQRYMFSRTSWRGIRGGLRHGGWSFGGLYLKMLLLQVITLGFATPYATVRLWNARMNDAMFGSLAVTASAEWRPLFRRFIVAWIIALLIYGITFTALVSTMGDMFAGLKPGAPPPDPAAFMGDLLRFYGVLLLAGIAIALTMLGYYSAVLRELFGKTQIGTMALHLSVTTGDLLRFYLGNVALVVFTLGLGAIMLPYRIFGFYARRLATIGTLDVEHLLQTILASPEQGDGLADAFDVSAF